MRPRFGSAKFLAVIAANAMIACCCAGAALAASCDDQRGAVIFEDNFTDDSGGWGQIDQPNQKFGGGAWSLHLDPKFGNWGIVNTTFNAQDADYCMEVVVPKSIAPGNAVDLELLFWATDFDNFYAAGIESDGHAGLWRKAAGQWQTVADLADPGVKFAPGSIAAIRVQAITNLIVFSVNGVEVKRVRAQMPRGQLKFGVYFETQRENPPPGISVTIKRFRVTAGPAADLGAPDKQKAIALRNSGDDYAKKGDLDRAIADYDEAIRLDPTYPATFRARGETYGSKGEFDRAIADFTEAIRLDPNYALAYAQRALTYFLRADYDRSIADSNKAIELNPKNAAWLSGRGDAYLATGENARAVSDYSEAIRLNPADKETYNSRANAYRNAGDSGHAIADYTDAVRLDPKFVGPYYNRGVVALYGGLEAKALDDFKHVIRLDPQFAYAALWLDIAARRNEQPSQLSEAIKRVDQTEWPAPILFLYVDEMTPEAVLAAADDQDSKTRESAVCEADFYIGELLLLRNDKDKARAPLQAAAESCPKSKPEWWAANNEVKTLSATKVRM